MQMRSRYVEHEQERGLEINSVSNHLHTLYAFLRYLTNNDVLSADILQKKIRIKLPGVLPSAIPAEDLQQILQAITSVRDRALVLLLLHTGIAHRRSTQGKPVGYRSAGAKDTVVPGGEKYTRQGCLLQQCCRAGPQEMPS